MSSSVYRLFSACATLLLAGVGLHHTAHASFDAHENPVVRFARDKGLLGFPDARTGIRAQAGFNDRLRPEWLMLQHCARDGDLGHISEAGVRALLHLVGELHKPEVYAQVVAGERTLEAKKRGEGKILECHQCLYSPSMADAASGNHSGEGELAFVMGIPREDNQVQFALLSGSGLEAVTHTLTDQSTATAEARRADEKIGGGLEIRLEDEAAAHETKVTVNGHETVLDEVVSRQTSSVIHLTPESIIVSGRATDAEHPHGIAFERLTTSLSEVIAAELHATLDAIAEAGGETALEEVTGEMVIEAAHFAVNGDDALHERVLVNFMEQHRAAEADSSSRDTN